MNQPVHEWGRRFAEDDGRDIDWRAIDRRLLDLLIARHGAPAQPPPRSEEEAEIRAHQQRAARAMAAADPSFVRRVQRHGRSGDDLIRSRPPATRQVRPGIGIDWDAACPRGIGEVRELVPSDALREAMVEKTPQAFLRDLHRPVLMFGDVKLRRLSAPTSSAFGSVRQLVRRLMSHGSVSMTAIQLASRGAASALAELRARLARPWEESRPEKPLPMPTRTPGMDDMIWFGVRGGYDPDL